MPRPPKVKKFGRPALYDWRALFRSLPKKLIRGRDYFCLDRSFALQARAESRRYGKQISIHIRDGYVVIREREEI